MINLRSISVIMITFFQTLIFSQGMIVSGDFGPSFKTNTYAAGLGININILYQTKSNNGFGLTIGNSFLDSANNLPNNLKDSNFHLRDYTNIAPLGEMFNFGWDIDAFPQFRLKSQPNRYFNFNLGFNYFYLCKALNFLIVGTELVLTYRDQMEIAKVLETKEMELYFPPEFVKYNYNIPIFSYDTYLDVGIAPYIQYNLLIYKRLAIGVKTKFYYFPKSRELIYNFGAILTWSKSVRGKNINETKRKKIK